MKSINIFCVLFGIIATTAAVRLARREIDASTEDLLDVFNATLVGALRQLMADRLYLEERTRSDGDSGIKQVRINRQGTKSYHSDTHTGRRIAAIHDHSNNIRTIGMGEFIGVLNGVEFRTRHNDYSLRMPSTTSQKYHATEYIPFPEVPPSVTDKLDVDDQIIEMRKYFDAWVKQDTSIAADYDKYFQAVLCYLEGAWTNNIGKIDESFESDRHFINAETWHELQNKIRFTAATGSKDINENFAYLPSTITNIIDGLPKFAQWNYRIMCHKIKDKDLPLNRLRIVDDLSSRMAEQRNIEEHKNSRAARFQLNPFDKNTWPKMEDFKSYGLLDELMAQIPGKNNYPANFSDNAFGMTSRMYTDRKEHLNAGYYHRSWQVLDKDAMGGSSRRRGYSDPNLFMAMNDQTEIVPAKVEDDGCEGGICTQKWSYAIPLEIIYLTPLSNWNPYDLVYRGPSNKGEGKRVTTEEIKGSNKKRNGQTSETPYFGTNSKIFFQTPIQFYTGKPTDEESDPADTAEDSVWIEGPDEIAYEVAASGHRIAFKGIGEHPTIRQRYPIMPVHAEGNTIMKELEALKTMVMDMQKYQGMFQVPPSFGSGNASGGITNVGPEQGPVTFWTSDSRVNRSLDFSLPENFNKGPAPHFHELQLTPTEVRQVKGGNTVKIETEEKNGHKHFMSIRRIHRKKTNQILYVYTFCDGGRWCKDRHGKLLRQDPSTPIIGDPPRAP